MLDIKTAKEDRCKFNQTMLGAELGIILDGSEIEKRGFDPSRMICIIEEMKQCGCPDCKGKLKKLEGVEGKG